MGRLRFPEIQTRPTEGLDLICLAVDAFQQLFPPFEAAFQTHMAEWRLNGQPSTARGSPTDQNSPLPAPEARLLWILVYLKTYPLQVVQGGLFGMGQSKAHRWIHVLLGALRATLRAGGCSHPVRKDIGPTSQGGRGGSGRGRRAYPDIIDRVHCARGSVHTRARLFPFGHDGTERRIVRPQNPIAPTCSDRGKKTCHTVKNLLLIEVALTILLRSHTDAGSTHD